MEAFRDLEHDWNRSKTSINVNRFGDGVKNEKPEKIKWCFEITQNFTSATYPQYLFLHMDEIYLLWQNPTVGIFNAEEMSQAWMFFFHVFAVKKTVWCFGMSFQYTVLSINDLLTALPLYYKMLLWMNLQNERASSWS